MVESTNTKLNKTITNDELVFYSAIEQSCIDRAASIAILTVPEDRRNLILTAIKEVKASIPSPDIMQHILTSTRDDDVDKQDYVDKQFIPDDSSVTFVTVFIDEFIRLVSTVLLYRFDPDVDMVRSYSTVLRNVRERVIVYFCISVVRWDVEQILEDICPYDIPQFPTELPAVSHGGWHCNALRRITINDTLRETNGLLRYSEIDFIRHLCGKFNSRPLQEELQ